MECHGVTEVTICQGKVVYERGEVSPHKRTLFHCSKSWRINLRYTYSFVSFFLSPSFSFLLPTLLIFFLALPSLLVLYMFSLYVLISFRLLSLSLYLVLPASPSPYPPLLDLRFISVSSYFCTLSSAQCGSWIRKVHTHPTLPLVLVWSGPKTRSGEMNDSFCVSKLECCFLRLLLLLLLLLFWSS